MRLLPFAIPRDRIPVPTGIQFCASYFTKSSPASASAVEIRSNPLAKHGFSHVSYPPPRYGDESPAPATTTVPYQPERDVDRFLRHAHALGIQHHQGDGALVATGMRICDAVRKGTPAGSVVLGFTGCVSRAGRRQRERRGCVRVVRD